MLDHELKHLGFIKCSEEHAVYRRGTGTSLLLVGVYVDDLIICGPDSKSIAEGVFSSQNILGTGTVVFLFYLSITV
jgi:hypothetical protein